jgi:4-hydroxy-4-methyl-2-oxoglutarate aldolase
MNSIVYTRIPACDPDLVRKAAACGVADLHEALGPIVGRQALMSPQMKALNPGRCIAGQAVTAFNFDGDNLMMHRALRLATEGQVLVTSNGGVSRGAQWGEMATRNARRKGLAGIIVDGDVRDSDAIREMGFPVWSTAVSPSHAEKRGPGAVNIPIVCAGALIEPGDVIVADGDGVIAIPLAHLERAIAGATAYGAREGDWKPKLEAGVDLFELARMQAALDAAKVEERDMTWRDDRRDA